MNLYEVLGVAPNDPALKIRARFRLLARATHPDMNNDQPSPEFMRYAQAYKTLSVPHKRLEYNAQQGIRLPPRSLKPGHDLYQRLALSTAEALLGGHFSLHFTRYEPCARCWLAGCPRCAENGLLSTRVTVTVRVPAQTQRAITVFVEGTGGVSEPGGQRGHLFVYIVPAPEQGRILATSVTRAEKKGISEPIKATDRSPVQRLQS